MPAAPRRIPDNRRMGGASRLPTAHRTPRLAVAFQWTLPLGPAHPPDLGDRSNDPVRPDARHDRPAGELVRTRQSQPPDHLHRSRLPAARRRKPDLHLGRRFPEQPTPHHRAELRGVVHRAATAGRSGNTGSTPISRITAPPGRCINAMRRSHRSATAFGRSPSEPGPCSWPAPTSGRSPNAWA